MENTLIIQVSGGQDKKRLKALKDQLGAFPGLESVSISEDGYITMLGADLDRMQIIDEIENRGFSILAE